LIRQAKNPLKSHVLSSEQQASESWQLGSPLQAIVSKSVQGPTWGAHKSGAGGHFFLCFFLAPLCLASAVKGAAKAAAIPAAPSISSERRCDIPSAAKQVNESNDWWSTVLCLLCFAYDLIVGASRPRHGHAMRNAV